MAQVVFIQPDGRRLAVEIDVGQSVMQGALDAGVGGIVAECGGCCTCGTCHCYVASEWVDRLPSANSDEVGILEFAWNPRDGSRLTCQIRMSDELDGLVLQVPERQL